MCTAKQSKLEPPNQTKYGNKKKIMKAEYLTSFNKAILNLLL